LRDKRFWDWLKRTASAVAFEVKSFGLDVFNAAKSTVLDKTNDNSNNGQEE